MKGAGGGAGGGGLGGGGVERSRRCLSCLLSHSFEQKPSKRSTSRWYVWRPGQPAPLGTSG